LSPALFSPFSPALPGFSRLSPGSQPKPREVCAGCDSPIRDRFLLRVNERSWHERCVRCSACLRPLSGSCFSRELQLFCRRDYEKLFPRRCSRCREAVGRSEPVQRVLERIFHERCFQCGACQRRLRCGDEFVLRRGRPLCRGDCERQRPGSPEPPESGNAPGAVERDGNGERGKGEDGKDPKRSKRPRTILSSQQRRAFKASFEVSSKPCRKVRETLAAETGLTVRVVQVWFQNQRAKMKKIARRQQQQQQQQEQQEQLGNSQRGAGRSSRDGSEDGEDAGAAPGLEGLLVPFPRIPPQPLLPLEQNGFGTESGMFRPGMTPPQLQPYEPEGAFQDLDGAALGPLGELLTAAESWPGAVPARRGNPIDRLCSMHSSYFSS
ncbi:LMX1A factor, partial [Orthonyx spaldingii]|nr:LMX1A factor [Orthonyx spaldingii]